MLYQTNKKNEIITDIYLHDILHLKTTKEQEIIWKSILENIYTENEELLKTTITLDDNEDFLRM
ncbi:TPA: hypothetical protein DEP21_03235 [Patescibacteria group bacterium]|nr:hypothetical protein [Candidatus Gracilibacteria bacterium]